MWRLRNIGSVPGGYATELAFAPDGEVWACARTGTIQLWRGNRREHEIHLPGFAIGRVRFSKGGLLLAGPFVVSAKDGQLHEGGSILDRLGFGINAGPLSPIQMAPRNAVFTPDTTGLMVYARYQPLHNQNVQYHGPHERLVLLDGQTREPLAVLWEANGLLSFSLLDATNTYLAAAGMSIRLWSRNPLKLLLDNATATPITAMRFSDDGQQLAYANSAGEVMVRGVTDQTCRHWLADPDGVSALCFSSDGKRILTGGRKGALAIWANESQPRMLAGERLGDSVDSLALAASGDRLLVAVGGGRQSIEFFEIDDHGTSSMKAL